MIPPRPLHGVCFDWDGTLLDSAEPSYHAYVQVFSSFGLPFDRAEYRRTYCPDWRRTYELVGLPQERWAEADGMWVEAFHERPRRLLPGSRELLERLRDSGLSLGLVTSGEGRRVRRELAELGLQDVFGSVICSEDVVFRKPDPDGLRRALAALQLAPQATIYVGDSPEDILMARGAGVFSVAVPGGFPNEESLRAVGADAWADRIAEVEALLRR
jgi:HAD superfamily hydrolase (TIGR01509 family)